MTRCTDRQVANDYLPASHPHLTTTEERITFMLIMVHPNNVQVHATGYAAAGQSSPSLGNIVKPRRNVIYMKHNGGHTEALEILCRYNQC